jgi:hypothetical protein
MNPINELKDQKELIEKKKLNEEQKIKKCLKSYLTAKKYYDTDIEKSYEYFKQCIKILNDLKDKNININNEFANIIEETETECSKYLTMAIETNIEKPSKKKIKVNADQDNKLFEIIETGDVNILRDYEYGDVDFNIIDENGLSPLHLAIKFGDTTFLKQAFKLGAGIDKTNKHGHSLLEFACLEKDPNMISFLMYCGSDMKKHLDFRDGKKYFNNGNQIDILLLEKKVMDSNENPKSLNKIRHLDFLFNYINKDDFIELEYCDSSNSTISIKKITFESFIKKLDSMVNDFDDDKRKTFINILKEELSYDLTFKLGCPINKIEILLYNLVPFIDYDKKLSLNWLISLEIKFIILKILKNKIKINTNQLKKELTDFLYLSYIKPEIVPEGLIQIIVLQWVCKIKV